MQQFTGSWTPFKDLSDQLQHYRAWGLIPPKSSALRPIMVTLGYLEPCVPCEVVGYTRDATAIIKVNGQLYAVLGEHLGELQPAAHQPLPRGMCFAQVLSDYVVVSYSGEFQAAHYQYGQKIAARCSSDKDLLDFLGEKPLICHDAAGSGLSEHLAALGVSEKNPLLETLPMTKAAFPLLKEHGLNCLKETFHLCAQDTEAINALLWACLAPRRHEAAYWNSVLQHGPAKCEKTPAKPAISTQSARPSTTQSKLPSNYVVFDIETTGLDKHNDRIIELAAIEYLDGKQVAEFSTFINPQIPIPAKITKITGITELHVMAAPTLEEIAISFLQFIGDKPLVGHNAKSFDLPFLEAQLGMNIYNPLIDTLPLARKAFPYLESHKLSFLKEALDLPDAVSHRALSDAETTNALLLACHSLTRHELPQLAPPVDEPEDTAANQPDKPASQSAQLEKDIYDALLTCCHDELQQLRLADGLVLLNALKEQSSICVVDEKHPACYIQARTNTMRIVFFEAEAKLLPADRLEISRQKSNSTVRVALPDVQSVALCKEAFLSAVRHCLSKYHTFDCCGRYAECSDAKRCLKPVSKENPDALGCTYGKRLRDGIIYYGKNKTNA